MGVQLRGAKMDRVDWGKAVLNEKLGAAAERKGKEHQAFQCYREALLVYQHLGRVYARNRDGKMASRLFMREMEMQRKLMPRGSVAWLWSMLVDLVCGYGEKPLRVFGLAFVIVLISGGFYSYTMASSVPLVRVGSTCYWAFRPRSVWWRMRSISSIARFSARRFSFRWAIPTRSMRGRADHCVDRSFSRRPGHGVLSGARGAQALPLSRGGVHEIGRHSEFGPATRPLRSKYRDFTTRPRRTGNAEDCARLVVVVGSSCCRC